MPGPGKQRTGAGPQQATCDWGTYSAAASCSQARAAPGARATGASDEQPAVQALVASAAVEVLPSSLLEVLAHISEPPAAHAGKRPLHCMPVNALENMSVRRAARYTSLHSPQAMPCLTLFSNGAHGSTCNALVCDEGRRECPHQVPGHWSTRRSPRCRTGGMPGKCVEQATAPQLRVSGAIVRCTWPAEQRKGRVRAGTRGSLMCMPASTMQAPSSKADPGHAAAQQGPLSRDRVCAGWAPGSRPGWPRAGSSAPCARPAAAAPAPPARRPQSAPPSAGQREWACLQGFEGLQHLPTSSICPPASESATTYSSMTATCRKGFGDAAPATAAPAPHPLQPESPALLCSTGCSCLWGFHDGG